MMRVLLLVIGMLCTTQPGLAERLVSTLSSQEISIDSNFNGESLIFFGNVEPDIGAAAGGVSGPFDIIIAIEGPHTKRVVRRKARQLGIWLNSEGVVFNDVPSFYHILTSQPLDGLVDAATLEDNNIGFSFQGKSEENADPTLAPAFAEELIRLMEHSAMFGLNERHVSFLSPSFYKAQIVLPANVPNGTYFAKTYLIQDGTIVDEHAERFIVRTAGIERTLSTSARDMPLLYGMACVALALLTGWIGSVAFRR